jgi:APA family basic amino acid/polyamine antiporter
LNYEVGHGWSLTGSVIDLPAVLLIFFIGIMISIGIKAAAHFTSIMVVIKLCTVLLFVVLGLSHINPENWTPFIPENTGHFGEFGWSGIMRAAGLVFFAYIGFDTVSTLAQDAKNPQKDLPRGILGSLLICTLAYIVVSSILTGIVSYKLLDVADPIAVALDAMGPAFFWVASIVKIAILAGLASVVLVQLLGQTRIFLAIGKDGLLPKPFAKLHHKYRTPLTGAVITTIAAMVLGGLFPVEILGQLVSMMTLLIFAIVCLGVWILRHTHPEFKRSFKVPFVPLIPILGIVSCIGQMFFLPAVIWVQMIVWLVVGFAIYFTFGIKNSKIRQNR